MAGYAPTVKPALGMTVSFQEAASQALAGIPARIIDVWPRCRSGDYLVTLEYEQPVKFRQALIQHIDAFMSELCQPDGSPLTAQPGGRFAGLRSALPTGASSTIRRSMRNRRRVWL